MRVSWLVIIAVIAQYEVLSFAPNSGLSRGCTSILPRHNIGITSKRIKTSPQPALVPLPHRKWMSAQEDALDIQEGASKTTTSSNIQNILDKLTNLFPFWVIIFSVLGVAKPFLFRWFLPYITPALTLTMMAMGMTLSFNDFKRVSKSWKYILIGFVAQYSIMPFSAFALTKIFKLGPELSAGRFLYCS